MTVDSTPEVNKKLWVVVPIVVSLVVLVGNYLLLRFRVDDAETRGTYGDMFGFSTAALTAAAFVALLYSLALQRNELAAQRNQLQAQLEELQLQREDQKESRAALLLSAEQQRMQAIFDLDALIQRHGSPEIQKAVTKIAELNMRQQTDPLNAVVYQQAQILRRYFDGLGRLLTAWPDDAGVDLRQALEDTVCGDALRTASVLDKLTAKYIKAIDAGGNRSAHNERQLSLVAQCLSNEWRQLAQRSKR